MHFSDHDLIDEILAGSHAAFERLIKRHEEHVYRIGYSYARQVEGALDISQNVFLKVHDRLGSYDRRSAFRTWLTRVAQNESVNWLRSQQRHTGHEELTPGNMPSYQPVQESAVLHQENKRLLLDEVHRLNPRQSQALTLRYFENMALREIAAVLGCSENQVKSILFRGMQKLRQRLPHQNHWDQELES